MENLESLSQLLDFDDVIKQQQIIAIKLLNSIESELKDLEAFSPYLDKVQKLKSLSSASLNCSKAWHVLQRMTFEKISDELAKNLNQLSDQELQNFQGHTLEPNPIHDT